MMKLLLGGHADAAPTVTASVIAAINPTATSRPIESFIVFCSSLGLITCRGSIREPRQRTRWPESPSTCPARHIRLERTVIPYRVARLTVRVDLTNQGAIGPGKIKLLELVGELGSISAAGRAMGMSYRRALDPHRWAQRVVPVARRHDATGRGEGRRRRPDRSGPRRHRALSGDRASGREGGRVGARRARRGAGKPAAIRAAGPSRRCGDRAPPLAADAAPGPALGNLPPLSPLYALRALTPSPLYLLGNSENRHHDSWGAWRSSAGA